ncbi:MAG: methionyl-tRNA formyltransferase [Candidatus Margulisbacteria bacterium]|jgi:methionyl-tRNA formyltransferase|nr:methionyl-tRNA formyltransferase [Candidatus Margulisiibacteriota bacterium]
MTRLAFFGSPDFALPSLQKILADERFAIALAVTQPDRPSGRGMRLKPTPIKQTALAAGVPVLENIPSAAELKKARVEKIAVVAYGRLIPAEITRGWECVNLHPSLLPKYRGASPLQSALLNGETKTAITTLLINEKMDAGDILLQEEIDIGENMRLAELQAVCAARGAALLRDTLLADAQKLRRPQDEAGATYCRKITGADSLIRPGEDKLAVHNRVRALGGRLTHRGKQVKILETKYQAGRLEIITVQPEGRAPLSYADFKNGYGEIIL